jgi:hypothetical protein
VSRPEPSDHASLRSRRCERACPRWKENCCVYCFFSRVRYLIFDSHTRGLAHGLGCGTSDWLLTVSDALPAGVLLVLQNVYAGARRIVTGVVSGSRFPGLPSGQVARLPGYLTGEKQDSLPAAADDSPASREASGGRHRAIIPLRDPATWSSGNLETPSPASSRDGAPTRPESRLKTGESVLTVIESVLTRDESVLTSDESVLTSDE